MNLVPDNNTESDWESQLAEYTLGVMEPSLAAEFEQSLEECRQHVALAQQYAQVVGMLGHVAGAAEPPEGHKSRFIAHLGSTPQTAAAPPIEASGPSLAPVPTRDITPPSRVADIAEYRERRSRRALPLIASVAAALLLFVTGFGWLSAQRAYDAAHRAELQIAVLKAALKTAPPGTIPFLVEGQSAAPDSWAICLVNPQTNEVTLVATELQPLSAEKVYELWWLPTTQDKKPVAAGTFNTDSSRSARHTAKAPEPVASYAGVAVSIEDAPGGPVGHGPLVLLGKYSLP